jgi:hypothetical protein
MEIIVGIQNYRLLTEGVFYKMTWIRNVRKMDRSHIKLQLTLSFIGLVKQTSLLCNRPFSVHCESVMFYGTCRDHIHNTSISS